MRKSVLTFCLLSASIASAQRPTLATLQPGDTIKVWAVGPRLNGATGAFAQFRSDTLTVAAIPFNAPALVRARVPYTALRRIEVGRGSHRSTGWTVAGIFLGAAAGLIVGGPLGTLAECGSNCGDDGDFEGLGGFLLGSAVGIVGGGIAGGVIGGRPRARWETVDLRR